jgi:hypothetical protein
MQKIILIDDDLKRQEKEYAGINLENYQELLCNIVEKKYHRIYKKLKDGKLKELNYDIVIIHASAFDHNENIFDEIQKFCQKKNKKLVYFSGGQPSVVYNFITNIMYLPSKTFYKNLSFFLEDQDLNINILAYGKNWKINSLNSVFKKIKKLTKEMKPTNKIRTKIFRKEVGLDLLEALIPYSDSLNKDFLEIADLEKIMKIIKVKIKDQI